MNSIGNILWLILGGLLVALFYWMVGLLMCITIIGIPFGVQLFKLGNYALWPFGHELVDKPGQLKDVSRIIADLGGNVTSVFHEHNSATESINGCYLRIGMETRNYDHVREITAALKKEGFKIIE